jgi:hypothetical protein
MKDNNLEDHGCWSLQGNKRRFTQKVQVRSFSKCQATSVCFPFFTPCLLNSSTSRTHPLRESEHHFTLLVISLALNIFLSRFVIQCENTLDPRCDD